jgi:drug/metabolite transporter (DMT)-like permease
VPIFAVALAANGVPVYVQVTARVVVGAAVLSLGRRLAHAPAQSSRSGITWAYALLLTAAFWTYIGSVAVGTPPPQAVAYIYLFPAWLVVGSSVVLKRRPSLSQAVAVAVGATGAVLTTGFWTTGTSGGVLGIVLAASNGVILAAIVLINSVRPSAAPDIAFTASGFKCATWIAAATLPWIVIGGDQLAGKPGASVSVIAVLLCGLSIVGTAVPYLLLSAGARRSDSGNAGVWLLAEPVTVVLLSVALLGDRVAWYTVGGVGLILLAAGITGEAVQALPPAGP